MDLKELLNLENKHIILKNVDGSSIGIIQGQDVKLHLRYNDISEFSFLIYKDNCPYYDKIKSYMRIEVEDIELFIVEKPQIINDGVNEYKVISCKSFEIDINRKTIPLLQNTYKFYSINPEEETICSIILSYLPQWSIKNVSSSLWNLYRTFDLQNVPLLQAIRDNFQNSFECVFEFNGLTKEISIIAYEEIPKKTDIFLSHNNLVNELQLTEKTENIYTALQVFGANIDINRVNILGNTIYNFNHFLTQDGFMSDTLKSRIIEWQGLIETNQPTYSDLLTQRAIKLSDMIALQVELTELQSQLKSLEITRDALLDSGLSATAKNTEVKNKRIEISDKLSQIDNKQIEIDNIDTQLQTIQNLVAFNQFFTQDELLQIEPFVIQTSITDDNFVVTSQDDELQRQNTAQDLYDKYKNLLEDASKLKYEFGVDLINFLPYEQYRTFVNQLQWGSQVTLQVNDEGGLVYPMLLGLDIEWGDNIDIQYLFSTEVKLSDAMMNYDDFSNEVSNLSNKMASDGVKWSEFTRTYQNDVDNLFKNGLRADLTEIVNSNQQELLINDRGLLGRRYISNGVFEDEQIKLIHNKLAFTRDNWNNLSTVIGKVTLPDGSEGYGINTEALMGIITLTDSLIVKNANNTFQVDASGAILKDASLTIEKGLNKILLDPSNGFKIQKNINDVFTDMIYLDVDGNLKVKGDIYGGSIDINSKFTVDNLGNMKATSGEFTGTITASNFNQGEITGSSININDNFVVDSSGNLTLAGDVILGGDITWNSKPSYTAEEVGALPSDTYIPTLPTYITSTKITSTTIESPTISAGNFYGSWFRGSSVNSAFIKIGLGNGSNLGDLSLYRGGSSTPIFQVYDDLTIVDLIAMNGNFLSSTGSTTYAYGNWNFQGTVSGIDVVAKFG